MRVGCYTEVIISLRALEAHKKTPRVAELSTAIGPIIQTYRSSFVYRTSHLLDPLSV